MAIVKTKLHGLVAILSGFNDRLMAREVGEFVVRASLENIAMGISPVRGYGRFPAYVADDMMRIQRKKLGKGAKTVKEKYYQKARNARVRARIEELKANYYPFSAMHKFTNKKLRPVNLKLSGDFLSKLDFKVGGQRSLWVGLYNATAKQKLMFETHNEGTHQFVPQRKFLPTGEGEQYTVGIMRGVLDIFSEWVGRKIKKSKVSID
jgi:hypothetical protein